MNLDTQKILKALFTSCLVVALVVIKSELEKRYHDLDLFLYFFLFLISLFVLSIIEVVFERLDESNWLKRVTNRRHYIQGAWLNYAMIVESREEIYNFALLEIDCAGDQIQLDGSTFKASITTDKQINIFPEGHFYSTIAQYREENSQLGFDFTVDFSDRVIACKHQIVGSATYFFQRGNKVPTSFQGEFSTQDPASFCKVIGHRLDENQLTHSGSLTERYRKAIEIAIDRNWIDSNQIPSPT